jgi:hypothetical protein
MTASKLDLMPRWLWTLIVLIVLAAFILPNPASAGATVGNAIESLIIFFQSMATAATT